MRGGAGSREAPQLFRDTRLRPHRVGGVGGSFPETKAPLGAVGVGRRLGGLCKNTCISPEWVFCGFGFGSPRLPVPLCVRGFAGLSCARAPFAASRLVVETDGRSACVRIRGPCLSTCLGCVSVECARAESSKPLRVPASLLSTVPPTWLQTFFLVPPATPAGSPPLSHLPRSFEPRGRGIGLVGWG